MDTFPDLVFLLQHLGMQLDTASICSLMYLPQGIVDAQNPTALHPLSLWIAVLKKSSMQCWILS